MKRSHKKSSKVRDVGFRCRQCGIEVGIGNMCCEEEDERHTTGATRWKAKSGETRWTAACSRLEGQTWNLGNVFREGDLVSVWLAESG
jgi:hypothetical protein